MIDEKDKELGPIGVVVVNYRSHQVIERNLALIDLGQVNARVVVVDNYSTRQEVQDVAALTRRLGWEMVTSSVNIGFGAAVNLGTDRATELGCTSYLMLNPDATVSAAVIEALRQACAADASALISPVIRRSDGSVWFAGGHVSVARGGLRPVPSRDPRTSGERTAEWITGACLALSHHLWARLGGFDEDYFLYWEDVDLSVRCTALGGDLIVRKDIEAVHEVGATQSGGTRKSSLYYYYNCRNRLLFAAKNLGPRDRLRWIVRTPVDLVRVVSRGGRREMLRPAAIGAGIGGVVAGLWWMLARQRRRPATPGARRAVRHDPGRRHSTFTVMQSFPEPRPTTNPYLTQLLHHGSHYGAGMTMTTFSWKGAVLGRFDVLHLHWPEVLMQGGSRWRTTVRLIALGMVLLRIRVSRKALVRTVHNVRPHESGSRAQSAMYRWCERQTTLVVRLNPHTPVPCAKLVETVPHGDYRLFYAPFPAGVPIVGRMLYFGLIRPYKGLDALVQAFENTADPALSLMVAGDDTRAGDRLRATITESTDQRISHRLEYLPDAELLSEIDAAQLVVLPYPDMHNSGAVFLALSRKRPVLVTDNAINRDLADEVGTGWVHLFEEPITAGQIERVAAAVNRNSAQDEPDLSARSWDVGIALHVAAYRRALNASQGRWTGRLAERRS